MKNRHHLLFLLIFFFLSGFAGLGYEMVWTRMLSFGLGHEIAAVLAVLTSFFSGLALGAWVLDRPASNSMRPGRMYAWLEGIIGLWSLLLIWLIPWANKTILPLFGFPQSAILHWLIAFGYTFILLLPATFAMGGTLPVIERLVSALRQNNRSVAGLYSVNTLGAMAGTIVTIFVLAPQFGFTATLLILASVNMICAIGVLLIPIQQPALNRIQYPTQPAHQDRRHLWLTLFMTGLLGIGFEVMVIRLLSQILQNTVYSFAGILSVYLFGTAVGAAIYQRCFTKRDFEKTLQAFLILLSCGCLISVGPLTKSQLIYQSILEALGKGFSSAIAGEMVVSTVVFLLPTLLMGMLFSHLAQKARTQRGGLGNALCINTLGASAASIVFGVLLLPLVGSKGCLVILSLGYLLLIRRRGWRIPVTIAIPVGLAGIILCLPFQAHFVTLDEGDQIIAHREGVTATVTVVKRPSGNTVLKVNNHFQMGGTSALFSDRRQGHIPLLLHPNPKRALFLGLGTRATFAAAAEHPGLKADGVELLPEIQPLLNHFEASIGDLTDNDSLNMIEADARRYINRCDQQYDVIIADLFHPGRDGAGALYTLEHFAAVKERLTEDGIFCQWLPLYQMDLETMATITRTFLDVFPDGAAFMTHYNLDTPIVGLIGSHHPLSYPAGWLKQRMNNPTLSANLKRYRLYNDFTLFGCYMADSQDLKTFAGAGPLNTDDHPVVMYEAPHFTYAGQEKPQVRLLALLEIFKPQAKNLIQNAPENTDMPDRLENYWKARDRFLVVGTGVNPNVSMNAMFEQIRGPFLEILKICPDFEAAYGPLVSMAGRLSRTNPAEAEQLMRELNRICCGNSQQ